MTNFTIEFNNPWLLLLLIPALFFALFFFLRLPKKFRRNRNRVISVVLHSLIMVLAVVLLAGIGFSYTVPNTENEILLLVDVSHSGAETQEQKDEFILSAIEEKSSTMKMGIVTFGYDQVYAAPLSYNGDSLYDEYLAAELPDTTATDFEAALRYAAGLFEHPESAKIVVISDGDETDGNALSVSAINTVAAEGIKVDTVFLPNENTANEVRIAGVEYPVNGVRAGEPFKLTLQLRSNYRGVAYFTMTDETEDALVESAEQRVELSGNEQEVELSYTFETPGLHEIGFYITSEGDTLTENNIYHSYYYLEVYDDILVIERENGDSAAFVSLLEETEYNATVVNIADEELPASVEELQAYDEVVLFNIAFTDMPEGFEEILYTYVYEIGGSLFTVGGNKSGGTGGEKVAHAYDRTSLAGSEYYGDMLPVELIDYTPPVGLIIIIDCSGSMAGGNLDLAKQSAKQCLNALNSRDYVGIMTIQSNYTTPVPISPMTDLGAITTAIDDITEQDATNYGASLRQAGSQLSTLDNVQKKHIIVISDAAPGDAAHTDDNMGYADAIEDNFNKNGITCSFVTITANGGSAGNAADILEETLEGGGIGGYYEVSQAEVNNLAVMLYNDLKAPEIKEYDPTPFQPKIDDVTGVVAGIEQADIPQLGGYYGTRLKRGALQPLITDYGDAPVYAQWDYGAGKVGSFLSDLYGTADSFSQEFLRDETGKAILGNILMSLYPSESIRATDITLNVQERNYSTQVGISTPIGEGETVRMTVTGPDADAQIEIVQPAAGDYFSSASFKARTPGLYTILVEKLDAEGNVVASSVAYRTFSYSAEYNVFSDEEACEEFMATLAYDGRGNAVTQAADIYEDLVRALERHYDPRILIAILIIVMFLLDVAVRKFKFKWPHEIIRDHRAKKQLLAANAAEARGGQR